MGHRGHRVQQDRHAKYRHRTIDTSLAVSSSRNRHRKQVIWSIDAITIGTVCQYFRSGSPIFIAPSTYEKFIINIDVTSAIFPGFPISTARPVKITMPTAMIPNRNGAASEKPASCSIPTIEKNQWKNRHRSHRKTGNHPCLKLVRILIPLSVLSFILSFLLSQNRIHTPRYSSQNASVSSSGSLNVYSACSSRKCFLK